MYKKNFFLNIMAEEGWGGSEGGQKGIEFVITLASVFQILLSPLPSRPECTKKIIIFKHNGRGGVGWVGRGSIFKI